MRLMLLAGLLMLSPLSGNDMHQLTVTGEGETSVQANVADIQVGIVVQKKTAADAQQDLAVKLKPILEKLRELKADKLETGTMQIFPEYDKTSPQKLIGYKGQVNIRFTGEAPNAGSLIDAAITAGANELTNVTLRPSDEILKEARLKALELACHDATEKAGVILKTLKLENKGITQVSTESLPKPYPRSYSFAAMAKAEPGSLEITTQEQTINAHIQLQIQIN